jgi:hypothetical protein
MKNPRIRRLAIRSVHTSSPTRAYLEYRNGNVRRSDSVVCNRALSCVLALSALSSAGSQEPIQVTVAELHRNPSRFHEREVLVRGELDPGRTPFDEMYLLRDEAHSVALVAPAAPGSDLTLLLLQRVETRGTFLDHSMQTPGEGWRRYGRFVILAEDIVEAPFDPPAAEPEEEKAPAGRGAGAPPPEIASIAPLAGRRDLHPSTVFEIRFSADMDETTFEGNVWLRLGDIGREPSAFVPAVFAYDAATRALSLTPLEPLPLLKQVSLSLYRGIAGADGQPLRVVPQAPKSIQSRRGALQQGADLSELVVLTFVTRGY